MWNAFDDHILTKVVSNMVIMRDINIEVEEGLAINPFDLTMWVTNSDQRQSKPWWWYVTNEKMVKSIIWMKVLLLMTQTWNLSNCTKIKDFDIIDWAIKVWNLVNWSLQNI